MLMRPWPVSAISTATFEGDDERLNRVKRVFIKTERDHMLDPQQQDSMIKKWPPSEVLVIDTDHSPFFSAPEQLFNLIVKSL
jgi:pimeloyl-ACP methyl ester carboxylesterase